jgi:hypothetical protein
MGQVLDGSRRQLIEQINTYMVAWANNPTGIGLTAGQITTLQNLLDLANTAYTDKLVADNNSKAATLDFYNRADDAIEVARSYVKTIKAKAAITNDPNIYVKAGIPEPDDKPTPSQPPSMPTDFSAAITNTGYVQVSWKGTRSSSIYVSIWRRLPEENEFSLIGTTTGFNFTDTTVPSGTQQALYFGIASRKGQQSDPTEIVNVNFGQMSAAA